MYLFIIFIFFFIIFIFLFQLLEENNLQDAINSRQGKKL